MTFKAHLKAFLVVVIAGSLMAWGVYAYMHRISKPGVEGFETIEELRAKGIPHFVAQDLNGAQIDTNSLKDTVVILNFWASWCGPCIEEVPSLVKLVEHFKGRVVLLAVSGDSGREEIDIFMKSFPGMKSPYIHIIHDVDRGIMKQYGVRRLPESLVVGKAWMPEKKLAGSIDWYTPEALSYIETLLK